MITKKWQRYPAYKDSGVEWLGEVPEHWVTWKVSHAFQKIGSGTTPSTNQYDYYEGDIPWVNTSELRENIITDTSAKLTDKALLDHSVLNLYSPGTLLIAMYGATIGRLGILGITACTNQACCALADPISLDEKFAFYWLWMRRNELIVSSSGGGQPNINQEKIRSIRIPAPPLPEQQAIAAFLDRETAKIDNLIAKKERLIELLKEKRTALISHAVTKGLNSDAPMKDSGVEWLGEVPQHWEIYSVKHLGGNHISVVQTGPFGAQLHASDYVDEGVPLILIRNVNNLQIDDSDIPKISEEKANTLPMYRLNVGDIVFSRVGSIGRIALVTDKEKGWMISGQMLRVRIENFTINKLFLIYLFSANFVSEYISLYSVGSTRDSINTDILRNISVPIPSLPEQQQIAQFLDRETAKIDALITKTRTSIEKLKEYRTALISAAVTGKIDIRQTKGGDNTEI